MTTAVRTSPATDPLNPPHTSPLTIITTIPSTTASTTGTATLPHLPTDCFMDNQKANEVYDLAYSDEPIAPRVKEALEVIDQALDDFK